MINNQHSDCSRKELFFSCCGRHCNDELFVAENTLPISKWLNRWTFQAIGNATVSVDSFFLLRYAILNLILLHAPTCTSISVKNSVTFLCGRFTQLDFQPPCVLCFKAMFWPFSHFQWNLGFFLAAKTTASQRRRVSRQLGAVLLSSFLEVRTNRDDFFARDNTSVNFVHDVRAHVASTPTSKRVPFTWHWPITKHCSTMTLTIVKTSCMNSPLTLVLQVDPDLHVGPGHPHSAVPILGKRTCVAVRWD